MSAHARPRPMGGPIWSKPFAALALVAMVGLGLIAYRLAVGLGATTHLSDGNPWGLWIATEVVIGTAFACGGYAAALLVYVFNKGKLHPLVRPALVTSLLGYTMGVVGVALDVGRPWLIWKVPFTPSHWNYDSVLFEVALCIGAYVIVLFIEASPVWLDKLAESRRTGLATLARRTAAFLERALPFILALGLLLPTMHQSSLGSLMLIAGDKLHPLWQTGWLPFLFLISVLAMGWAVITFETTLANHSLRLPVETDMLRKLWVPITGSLVVFTVVRFADLAMKGNLGLAFDSGYLSAAFWLETTLILGGGLLLAMPSMRARRSSLFTIALIVLAGGSLYRLDTFILAFNPGSRWAYFPSAIETFVTVGIIALQMLLWIVIVKRLPVLAPATPRRTP